MADSKQPPTSGATVVADGGPGTTGAPPPVQPAPSAPPPPVDSLVGTVLAERYKIQRELGEGGMGKVYMAEHVTIRKRIAIKVLSPEYSHKQDLVDRFLQEARAASMISQENVVEITDFGSTPGGSVFFVMEFLDGEDLSDTVKKQGALPWERVKGIMLQICRALQAAHDNGIIHRDMKPENCYRIKRGTNDDFIKVLDFGIAKVTSEEGEGGKGLTRTGMIFGTPEYMSPEQAQGAKPDHRVDVYALGVIMYELLTGRVPFTADTFMGILTKHMFEVPEAPSTIAPTAQIPPDAEAIILKAMQKDREYRFQDMTEMAEAISAVGGGGAAVDVVHENIARPSSGEMAFSGPAVAAVPGTYPPATTGEIPLNQGGGKGVIIAGAAAILMIVGGVGGYFAFAGGEEPPPEPAPVEVVAPPPAPEPKPEPKPEPEQPVQKVLAPGVETVFVKIKTPGVDGQVLDARDESLYGPTNDPKGFAMEKSKKSQMVIVRAEGYEDLIFEVTPNRDPKTYTKKLQKLKKKKRPKKGSKADTGGKQQPGLSPIQSKKVEPSKPKNPPKGGKKGGKKGVGSPDLKDPFKKHGGG